MTTCTNRAQNLWGGITFCFAFIGLTAPSNAAAPRTTDEVLAASAASDWRALDAENTLYWELPNGRVVIELAPSFAPTHVAAIKALVREGYYNHTSIIRVQDNYVAQLGSSSNTTQKDGAKKHLLPEFTASAPNEAAFARLPDGDVYAPEVGFSAGFPIAWDRDSGRAWLVHCYGMVGAARDIAADSADGTELYVAIGQPPRQLDRNATLVGRVVWGMELLS
jgi:peptidylprolyl isomerase